MSKTVNHKRNLLIIGNGHDLSLGLKSSFNNYIGINSPSDYCTYDSKFNRIYYFIKLFHKSQKELMYKLRMVKNKLKDIRFKPCFLYDKYGKFITHSVHLSKKNGSLEQTPDNSCYVNRGRGSDYYPQPKAYFLKNKDNSLKLDDDGNPIERSYVFLGGYEISRDYFVLKLFFNKDYKVTRQSFSYVNGKDLDPFRNYDALDGALNRLNNWGNQQTDKLLKAAKNVNTDRSKRSTNFWNLLMLFEMYIDIRSNISRDDIRNKKISFFPRTWYDVENTIKEYLISIVNQPINNRYILNHSYHTLNYYVNNANITSRLHFNFFTGISRYIDLLHDVSNVSKRDSFSLYERIINHSKYNNLLSHTIINSSESIRDALNILPPFMFLMLHKFGQAYISGDKSLFSFLHKQLKDFDKDFSYYLGSQIGIDSKHIDNYKEKSLNHLKDLSVTSNLKTHTPLFSVLDFNYTPLSSSIKHYEHIHGSLKNGHIVIGIGEQTVNRLKPKISNQMYNYLYSFTKTYQLFSFNKRTDDGFLNNVKNIVFFGHSFGVNDFPYFEALFDHFKIYSNHHINLIFAYCGHGDTSYEEAKMRLVPRIVSLLKDYSRSLSQAHSDNLIAKMFMENRIKLYPVHFGKRDSK